MTSRHPRGHHQLPEVIIGQGMGRHPKTKQRHPFSISIQQCFKAGFSFSAGRPQVSPPAPLSLLLLVLVFERNSV